VHAADADVIVDALFGTGLNRAPEGMHAEVIRSMNELALPIVAVDVPSGANASSAEPFDPCVQAAVTVTFAAPKICHVFEPAAILCGEVIVADISIPTPRSGLKASALSRCSDRPHQPFIRRGGAGAAQGHVRPRRDHRGLRRKKRRGGNVRARRDPNRRGTGDGDDRRRDRQTDSRRVG
jgi:hypothetical protein